MGRLSEIFTLLKSSHARRFRSISGTILLWAIFSVIISGSFCFREDVFNSVKLYNSADSDVVPYYIEVISVSPANGASGVAVTSVIAVEFNDNIDMATVNSGTFSVTDGVTPVAGEFSYDAQLKTVSFTPGTIAVPVNLSPSIPYYVYLTTGIKNVIGESMAAEYSWSFTTGLAIQPEIYILPELPLGEIYTGNNYDFGNAVSLTSKSSVFTIGNSGEANLVISSVILSDPINFSVSAVTPSATITPGGTSTITVVFQPNLTAGLKNSIMTLANNDADEGSFIINLKGEGLAAPAPEIQFTSGGEVMISPVSTVDLGSLIPGATGTMPIVLKNIGSSDLIVNVVTLGGTNPGLFSTDFVTPATVTSGSTLSFNVSFSSPDAVNARATISFQNNDLNENPFTIKLKGRVK